MSYKVTVSGLSPNVTETQLEEFFSFCGKVTHVELQGTTATVTFEKLAAVKTALLLSDSELGGSKVTISADEKTTAAAEQAGDDDHHQSSSSNGKASPPPYGEKGDISQEYKPRSTILAEYLSHGYVLGDKAVARGLQFDEKHGISHKFTKFLKDLDDKYKVQDKAVATDQAYGLSDKALKGQAHVSRYFDKAINTQTGAKVHSFYTQLVKEAQDVHTEARRLADHKKENEAAAAAAAAPESSEPASNATSGSGEKVQSS